jgi:hypothetical protein
MIVPPVLYCAMKMAVMVGEVAAAITTMAVLAGTSNPK